MGLAAAIGVGAVASVAGGAIAAGGAKSAANASAAAADRSAQVQQQIYGENKQLLSPFVGTGNAAMGQINALLGIDDGSVDYQQYLPQREAAPLAGYSGPFSSSLGYMLGAGRDLAYSGLNPAAAPNYTPEEIAAAKQQAIAARQTRATDAFNTYRNSTGYDFRVNEGMRTLNSGYAGAGTIKSGAAMKAAVDYGQGMASQEFGNYLNALGNQQGVGVTAGGALAGVGTDYANSLGNIYMQNGANQANASLAKANALGSGVGNIGSLIGLGMGAGLFK